MKSYKEEDNQMESESDMALSDEQDSDVDMEVDENEENLQNEDEDEDIEEEEDEEDEIHSGGLDEDHDGDISVDVLPHPRLRIKLKLPSRTNSNANTSNNTPTPEDISPSKTSRHGRSRVVSSDLDIESEDEDEDNEQARSTPSGSTAGPSSRPMTARQAVLASVVDPTHVSLNEGARNKKKQLNESELALRREETARKRKNMSEKKLEDEKAETINRLLKKQSRPKNKRTALGSAANEERTPIRTPPSNLSTNQTAISNGEQDEDINEEASGVGEEITPPTMYRWVSSSRMSGKEREMSITFSVPTCVPLLPPSSTSDTLVQPTSQSMDIDTSHPATAEAAQHDTLANAAREKPKCAVAGCVSVRKYRLVRNWEIGACGLDHLKALEAT